MSKNNILITLIIILFSIAYLPFSDAGEKIPTSSRARRAITKVTPVLKKELTKANFKYGDPLFIRIFKKEKVLEVWINSNNSEGYRLFKTYPICTYGNGGLGPKIKQGDGQAPEGFYFVKTSSLNPVSNFHLSFNLGYPNRYDRAHKRTGSALMVHGSCVSIGCYAMTDDGIEEIYALSDAAFRNGQRFFRVHIFPFKMNNKNMEKNKGVEWFSFWENLKEGYDFFNNHNNIPPNVEVNKGQYVFNLQ